MTARDSAPRVSRVPFAALIASVSIAMSIFFTLYSLIPVIRPETPELSSLFVGTMMAVVMGVQVLSPLLVRRFSLRGVISATTLLLGVGALITGFAPGAPLLLVGAIASGAAFGIVIVAGSQGVALLVPPPTLSRSIGIYGLLTMAVTAVGSPIGVQAAATWSPELFGIAALAAGVLGCAMAFGIPGSVGRGGDVAPDAPAASTTPAGVSVPGVSSAASAENSDGGASGNRRGSGVYRSTPWLVLAFLLSAVLVLSHGLLSFPQMAAPASAALLILFVQAGNAVGRWLGGELESRAGAVAALLIGTALLVVGCVAGVLVGLLGIAAAVGFMLGVGVGVVQTATLHAAMLRMDPGAASVVWNLSVDGGLWLGGILWGLALTTGTVKAGAIIISALTLLIGLILTGRLRRR